MKYTAEKVRALFEAWAEENGYDVLRIEPDYNDGFTAAAWHGYQAAYAERIKADEMAADYPECSGDPASCPENEGFGCCKAHAETITLHPPAQAARDAYGAGLAEQAERLAAQPAQSVDVEPVAWLCDNGASENLMVTLSPRGRDAYAALGRTITPLYTHPAPPIDLAAVREVIESHINEAKKLRHDPESQEYLYEQADKLEAALQERGNG